MSRLTIISRKTWGAAPPTEPRTRRTRGSITELFLHWPGSDPVSWAKVNTPEEERATLRNFQRHHQQGNGWADIGYNHVMGNAGDVPRIYTARGAQYIPAAQLGHNTGTIALCILIGPHDPLTDAMVRRVRSYIRWAEEYSGNRLWVRPHRAVVSTDCPGQRIALAIGKGLFDIHDGHPRRRG